MSAKRNGPVQRLGWAATFGGAALLCCLVALANGGPVLFPDTLAYLLDGRSLVHLDWPGNERPVFYGLAIWFLHWERGIWPVLLLQGLILSHLIWLTLRATDAAPSRTSLLVSVLLLAILSPLSWYVSHVMPDVFAGVVILGLFLLVFCRDRLRAGEVVYIFLLTAASISFHLSYLVVACALLAVLSFFWLVRPGLRPLARLRLPWGAVALALLVSLSFSLVVYKKLSLSPKSPPFLMARLIADGPAREYLRATCGRTDYVTCRYLDRMPSTENGILWEFLAPMRSSPEFWAIRDEEGAILRGTFLMFPWQVTRNAAISSIRQLFTIGSETEFTAGDWLKVQQTYPFAAPSASRSLQARGLLDSQRLAPMNAVHAAAALVSAAACIVFALSRFWATAWRLRALFGTVLLGLLLNAGATGSLAGVFGRYQGRAIWLLAFCAVAACLYGLRRSRQERAARPAAG